MLIIEHFIPFDLFDRRNFVPAVCSDLLNHLKGHIWLYLGHCVCCGDFEFVAGLSGQYVFI